MLKKIRAIFFDNFIIKAFSLLFAVVLWFHVVSRGKSEVDFVLPLELKDVPRNMTVVGEVPDVDVRLQGQEGILKGLSSRDLSASLSLTGGKEGESVYYLGPSNIRVPSNITVTRVSPVEVSLKLEYLTEKTVPVLPVLSGKPAKGYRLDKVEVSPDNVVAIGPKSQLAKLESVSTRTVDITGATGGFDKPVMLEPPALRGVKLEQESAVVAVKLAKARK